MVVKRKMRVDTLVVGSVKKKNRFPVWYELNIKNTSTCD